MSEEGPLPDFREDQTPDPGELSSDLRNRFSRVRLLLCDVDGVLTDAGVYIAESPSGPMELKRFNIQDGLGLVLLRSAGIKVGWISARMSSSTQARARELGIDFLAQGKRGKLAAAREVADSMGITLEEVCFIGDDIVDLAVMKKVGLAAAVRNARKDVIKSAHYRTRQSGGHGAVREVCELILKATGLWDQAVEKYFGDHE